LSGTATAVWLMKARVMRLLRLGRL